MADTDVLIVGAGPTGVTLALLLARAGVKTVVIDREANIYPLPRAAHIDHEIMRVLQEIGVADSVMATSRAVGRYDFLTADRQILLRFDSGSRLGSGGWPPSNMIHQPSLEAALRAALAKEPNATLLASHAFRGFEEDSDGISARVDRPAGEMRIAARYLVGADGARSPVRAAAGIGIDDLQFDEQWLVIDTFVHDPSRLPTANLQICDPARPTTCVIMGAGRHRWEFMLLAGEAADDVLDDAFIAHLLTPWDVAGAVTLERKAVYRFNARLSTSWRQGRVLLAGDAAHQMPPFAGQGLCSGVRDAANLAWKLATVLRSGDDALLDTYQPEREPNVRGIVDVAMMMGRIVCITDPAAAAARDTQMLAARDAGAAPDGDIAYPPVADGCILKSSAAAGAYFPQFIAAGAKLDDVLGAGFWLLSRAQLREALLSPFAPAIGAWLDNYDAEAVLVRPDRYVFGTGSVAMLNLAWREAAH